MATNIPKSAQRGAQTYTTALADPSKFEARDLTFPQLLIERALAEPDEIAYCRWDGNSAIPTTWGEYAGVVREVALGLDALGVASGDRVAIMAQSRAEWVEAAMGILSVGAFPVGVYPTSSAAEVQRILKYTEATSVFVESEADVGTLLSANTAELPALRAVVGFAVTPDGFPAEVRPVTWDELRAIGRNQDATDSELFDRLVEAGDVDQPAAMFHSSGSTGVSKGIIHTHRTLQYSSLAQVFNYPEVGIKRHDLLGFLGLSHVAPALLCVFIPIVSRLVITFCTMEQRVEGLRGVRPTAALWPPRMYEKLLSETLEILKGLPASFQENYAQAMEVAQEVSALRWRGEPVPQDLGARYERALEEVFIPLRAEVGMDRCETMWTASGAMTPEVMALWQMWGVDLRELFGTTETCGSVLAQWDRAFPPPGTVGKSLPDPRWKIKVSDSGELLVSAPLLFAGYWNNDAETEAVMDGEWYRTGDLAEIDATGEVTLIGRIKDIIITSGGKTISPQPIEVRLKASPLIEEAVVVGEGRKYLSVLVWASEEGKALDSEALHEGVSSWITEINSELARPLQLKDFRLPQRELSLDRGELTLKGTIRRAHILTNFIELVDDMYDSREQSEISRQARLSQTLENGK